MQGRNAWCQLEGVKLNNKADEVLMTESVDILILTGKPSCHGLFTRTFHVAQMILTSKNCDKKCLYVLHITNNVQVHADGPTNWINPLRHPSIQLVWTNSRDGKYLFQWISVRIIQSLLYYPHKIVKWLIQMYDIYMVEVNSNFHQFVYVCLQFF